MDGSIEKGGEARDSSGTDGGILRHREGAGAFGVERGPWCENVYNGSGLEQCKGKEYGNDRSRCSQFGDDGNFSDGNGSESCGWKFGSDLHARMEELFTEKKCSANSGAAPKYEAECLEESGKGAGAAEQCEAASGLLERFSTRNDSFVEENRGVEWSAFGEVRTRTEKIRETNGAYEYEFKRAFGESKCEDRRAANDDTCYVDWNETVDGWIQDFISRCPEAFRQYGIRFGGDCGKGSGESTNDEENRNGESEAATFRASKTTASKAEERVAGLRTVALTIITENSTDERIVTEGSCEPSFVPYLYKDYNKNILLHNDNMQNINNSGLDSQSDNLSSNISDSSLDSISTYNTYSSDNITTNRYVIPHTRGVFGFGHVNIRGLNIDRNKETSDLDYIQGLMIQRNIAIVSINETFLTDREQPPGIGIIFDWEGYGRGGEDTGGGTGILFRSDLGCKNISEDVRNGSEIEFTAVTFQFHGRRVLFLSVYIPPDRGQDKHYLAQLSKLVQGSDDFDTDFTIFAGDFNAWHTDWGDRTDSRGIGLVRLMSEFDFEPLQMPSPTRFGNANQRDTYPDIFFVSQHQPFSGVLVGPRISDHAFCQGTFSLDLTPLRGHHVFDFHMTYMDTFRMDDIITYFDNLNLYDIYLDSTLDGISEILSQSVLKPWREFGVIKFVNQNSKPWYTKDVKGNASKAGVWERRFRKLKK